MSSFSDALGWVLLHSFWQGPGIAVLVFLFAYRMKEAQQRYWVAYSGLVALLATACFTFYWYLAPGQTVLSDDKTGYFTVEYSTEMAVTPVLSSNFWDLWLQWIEANKPYLVSLWLAGFALALLRLLNSWFLVRKLRTRYCFEISEHWQSRMSVLALQIGLTRPVLFLESALAKTPMALGWLKPMIVFPVGLINQLSPAETEAVLAHELAHLSRRDWVFNFLQACIETLFYYHPAVWWMSAMVRRERENACDDRAVALIGNRIAYAKTLVRLQEMAKTARLAPDLALGITGNNSITRLLRPRLALLERIRRVLQQPQPSFNAMEKLTATAVLLVLLLAIGWRANADSSISSALSQIAELPAQIWEGSSTDTDSLPKPKTTRKSTYESDNQKVEVEYKDNVITRMNIDGREIPAEEFSQHQGMIEDLMQRTPPPPPPPPVPGMPAMPGMPPSPPSPPDAPAFPGGMDRAGIWTFPDASSPTSILVNPSSEGATIMQLNSDGKPTEIRVENGEVWIDGKKVEKGQSFEFPAVKTPFPTENGYFFWNGDNKELAELEALRGNLAEFPANFDWAAPAIGDARAKLEADMERLRADMERLRDSGKISDKEFKKREKEFRKVEEKFKKLQEKQFDSFQESRARDQELIAKHYAEATRHQADMAKHQAEIARSQVEAARAAKSGNSAEFWLEQLYKDGVISDKKKFSMSLSSTKMMVNGNKLSDEQHRRYFEIFTARGGKFENKNSSMTLSYETD